MLIARKNSNETLKNISPFLIKKVIDNVCGEVDMCKKIRSGELLVKTKNATQATKLIQLVSLNNEIRVEVKEHNYHNTLTAKVLFTITIFEESLKKKY